MQTLPGAFRCVLFVFVLFSCNTTTNEKSTRKDIPVTEPRLIKVSVNEDLDIESLHTKFINASKQHFCVPAKKISLLKSKAGLKITVNPVSLEREDGSPIEGIINVSVVDLTSVDDLFKSNAATVSNGKLLASGGSYFIGMENGGNKLRIKEGQTIQVEFPLLKKEKMELFYGQRDAFYNMNWQVANMKLEKQSLPKSSVNSRIIETAPLAMPLEELVEPRIFKSLEEPVYYLKTRMTLASLVDTINKKDAKVYLQTISRWPKNLPTDRVLDSNYLTLLYGPRKQYLLRVCKDEQKENEVKQRRKALQMAAVEKWQPQTIEGQIQKYYAPIQEYYTPSNITSLGWLNCDRIYNQPRSESPEVELPYAFTNTRVQYFLLYKSFNGLVSGTAELYSTPKFTLQNLPLWQEVTLIAFTKKNGTIYQAKEDFVVGGNKSLHIKLEKISTEAFTKMFGSNIRI